jgi:hypothetical protein
MPPSLWIQWGVLLFANQPVAYLPIDGCTVDATDGIVGGGSLLTAHIGGGRHCNKAIPDGIPEPKATRLPVGMWIYLLALTKRATSSFCIFCVSTLTSSSASLSRISIVAF